MEICRYRLLCRTLLTYFIKRNTCVDGMYSSSVQPQYIVPACSYMYVCTYVHIHRVFMLWLSCHWHDQCYYRVNKIKLVRWTLFLCMCALLTEHAQTCLGPPEGLPEGPLKGLSFGKHLTHCSVDRHKGACVCLWECRLPSYPSSPFSLSPGKDTR